MPAAVGKNRLKRRGPAPYGGLSFRGALAQLVRALPCHGRGCGFEPRRLRFFRRSWPALAILLARLAAAGTLAGMTSGNQGGTRIRHCQEALRRRLILFLVVGTLTVSGARTVWAQGSRR